MIYIEMISNKFWRETYMMYPVFATNFVSVVLASWNIEAFSHLILPILLFSEWSYCPPNSKIFAFCERNKCYKMNECCFAYFNPKLNLGFRNFRPIFLKKIPFLVATIFLYLWLSVWVDICIINIWR